MSLPSSPLQKVHGFNRREFLHTLTGCALSLLLAACTAPQPLPTPGAGWKSYTGQLLYRAQEGRSVIGEVVVRNSGQTNFALDFLSGPGFPLLKIQVSGEDVVAEGVLARGRWRGNVQNAPKALQGWIGLREIFAQVPGKLKAPGWVVDIRSEAGRPKHIEARFTPTGERFAFHFSS